MNNLFASPSNNLEDVKSAIGCHTAKSGGVGNKSFNLKIKLKNESSFKKLKVNTNKKASDNTVMKRSSTKDETQSRANLSAPRNAYNSYNQINHSGIETSHIVDEKLSDMSFSINMNEIIGSFDEKNEITKMREELKHKDECI